MPQCTRWNVVQLVDFGSWIVAAAKGIDAMYAIHNLQLLQLARVGRIQLAAAPQYKPFYPFPIINRTVNCDVNKRMKAT